MASAKTASSSKKSNQNYSTSLAGGGSVSVKNGVKTYSNSPLKVKGNNGISISGESYSRNKGGSGFSPAVAASDIGTKPADLPTLTKPAAPTINLDGATGMSVTDNQYTPLPSVEGDTIDASNGRALKNKMAEIGTYLGIGANDNKEADYLKMEKKAGIKKMQDEVNQYSGTLNSIVANRDAQSLALEGQGRGQTTSFVGGEQGRINREAAIAALPVQAQLATAQGNLTQAQAHLDKMFSLRQADVTARHDFNVKMVDSLYQFMDKQETNRANLLLAKDAEKTQEKQNNINYLRSLSSTAIQMGLPSLVGKLGSIDPNSPTFEQDVASVQGQMRLPQTATKRDTKDINGKLVDMQTGEIIADIGGGVSSQEVAKNLGVVSDIENLVADPNFAGSFGLSNIVGRNVPGTPSYAIKQKVQNVLSELALAARGELKGQGAVSDFEGKLLSRAQTSLTLNLSSDQAKHELKQVSGAIRTSSGLTAPVKITDPKTGESTTVQADSTGITQAIADGFLVEYK